MNEKRVSDALPKTQQEPSESSMLKTLFGKKEQRPAWPLWFSDYLFDARCYNTLKCSIVFNNQQHAIFRELNNPSGQPKSLTWKDNWTAGYAAQLPSEFERKGFPSPIEIDWTALDGQHRRVNIDLEEVFPGHYILHNVPKEEIPEDWIRSPYERGVQILLEVNDRTINIYMRAMIMTKESQDPNNTNRVARRDLMLAWTKTYD